MSRCIFTVLISMSGCSSLVSRRLFVHKILSQPSKEMSLPIQKKKHPVGGATSHIPCAVRFLMRYAVANIFTL